MLCNSVTLIFFILQKGPRTLFPLSSENKNRQRDSWRVAMCVYACNNMTKRGLLYKRRVSWTSGNVLQNTKKENWEKPQPQPEKEREKERGCRDGKKPLLLQGGLEQRCVDGSGGQDPHRLHQSSRRGQMEEPPQESRSLICQWFSFVFFFFLL